MKNKEEKRKQYYKTHRIKNYKVLLVKKINEEYKSRGWSIMGTRKIKCD